MGTIAVERLLKRQPILEARPENDWESRVVLNPAADLVKIEDTASQIDERWELSPNEREQLLGSGAACAVLYRAQGTPRAGHEVAASSLGLAIFTQEFKLVKRWGHPVIAPDADYHNLGVEDPRITRVGDTWHMYYAGYSGDPAIGKGASRKIQICHASSNNLVDWNLTGPISGSLNSRPNKNAALLPKQVDGLWILLHRPMEGNGAMEIQFATSSQPDGPWDDKGILMVGLERPDCARSWVGAGGPPVALGDDRFLMIYHRGAFDHENRRAYDLAAALLDFRSDEIVRARIEPLMQPSGALEQKGDPIVGVDNVLFTCANYADGDSLVIPYAGADSRIFVGSTGLSELVGRLETLA